MAAAVFRQGGQEIVVHWGDGTRTGRGMVQATSGDTSYQNVSTPLGIISKEEFLYLGTEPLTPGQCWVTWQGRSFDVRIARPVYVGARLSHWWGILWPRDEEET